MHILIPESILPTAIERLQKYSVHYDAGLVNRHEALIEAARCADAIIVRRLTQVRGRLLDAMSKCKAVGRLGVGLDNIDMQVCRARGIEVIPAVGANARSVAEYVIGAAFSLVRGVFHSSDAVTAGHWPKDALNLGGELFGRTIGIVGFGSIGKVTAELARTLGMRVLVHDQHPADVTGTEECVTLDELMARSDVVTLHVPLSPETRYLIDKRRLSHMKADAVLINAARGGIVDETALIAALRDGQIRGAALDAFENEPLGPSPQYEGVPNLILTPHVAGVTRESEQRVTQMVIDRLLAVLER